MHSVCKSQHVVASVVAWAWITKITNRFKKMFLIHWFTSHDLLWLSSELHQNGGINRILHASSQIACLFQVKALWSPFCSNAMFTLEAVLIGPQAFTLMKKPKIFHFEVWVEMRPLAMQQRWAEFSIWERICSSHCDTEQQPGTM